MFESCVLGVDPGLSRCGWALVDGPARRASLRQAEVVRTPADQHHGDRLRTIHDALRTAIRDARPAHLAVERVFINAQAQTGIGAVQVVGLVHLLGATLDLPVTEYTPSQVKAAVTGVGDADKDQVTFMVQRMLRLPQPPKPADKADALAVALCHLHQPRLPGHQTGTRRGTTSDTAGLPPRLAQALEQAGPGLQPLRRPR